jgi:hypothetical protein
MQTHIRQSVSIVLTSLLVISTAPAQQPSSVAPIPPQILSAHSVFIANGGGSTLFDAFTGGPDRAYNTFYADLQKANHYQLVATPTEADLVFEIRAIAPTSGSGDTAATTPQLVLDIKDPKTSVTLWTTRANVRAFGTQSRRDQGFDSSVDVLVSKLAQVTGQLLTPQEAKAVHDNSRLPTAAKVLIVVGIAAGLSLGIYGAYRVSHPPALPTLSVPSPPMPWPLP